jgi:hypothetical protein
VRPFLVESCLLQLFQAFNAPASKTFAQSSDADGGLNRFGLYVLLEKVSKGLRLFGRYQGRCMLVIEYQEFIPHKA